MTNHPITPSHELIVQWETKFVTTTCSFTNIAHEIAQWGADQELEKCCEWLVRNYNYPEAGNPLHTARRPKPPSLKDQALEALAESALDLQDNSLYRIIYKALEQLPND